MLKTREIEKILAKSIYSPKLENILTPHLITRVNTIYKIGCKKSPKCYIGQCKDRQVIKRWREHIRGLRKGTHHSHKLQRAYNKYGEENFTFEVIECTLSSFLDEKEIDWIDCFDSYYNGYNETLGGEESPMLNPRVAARNAEARYKPVYSYSMDDFTLKTYPSRNSVKEGGFNNDVVGDACNNKYCGSCIYRGYIWSYKELTLNELKKIKSEYVPANVKKSKSMKVSAKISKSESEAIAKIGNKTTDKQKISNDLYVYIAEKFLRGLYPNKTACAKSFGVDPAVIRDMFNYKYCRKACRNEIIRLCEQYNYPMKGLEVT